LAPVHVAAWAGLLPSIGGAYFLELVGSEWNQVRCSSCQAGVLPPRSAGTFRLELTACKDVPQEFTQL